MVAFWFGGDVLPLCVFILFLCCPRHQSSYSQLMSKGCPITFSGGDCFPRVDLCFF